MKIRVVVGVWQGVLNDIEAFAFSSRELADQYEAKLKEEYGRKGDVQRFILTVDEWKPSD